MNRVWTEEELDILRRDREARIPIPVTAAKLGRPVPATYARARLIGTLVQPHQSWDEASESRLRELVSSDPPMTDKRIAAELGRTVTQIRWKMKDLGLIGVRDLSKLAKVTASGTVRPKAQKPTPQRPAPVKAASPQPAAPAQAAAPVRQAAAAQPDSRTALDRALASLERTLAERLRNAITASETGMIQAAKDAIAEKSRIDQRLGELGKQIARDKAQREAEAAAKREAEKAASALRAAQVKAEQQAPRRTAPEPAARKPVLPAVQGVSRAASPPPPAPPAPAEAPKIVVTEAPAAARPVSMDSAPAQVSGRGGWKSVRRDPARITAQAKAKATSRADAVDLAQAAQSAIERFIAERGITRTETDGTQAIVSRLQARGYIVVREGDGWMIDQRHRVGNEADLAAFAEARGITLSIAA